MMRWFKNLLAVVLMALMAACGGGGGSAGTSVFDAGTGSGTPAVPVPVASVIALDLGGVTSITNNGSDSVTATVTAKNSSNVVLAAVPVTISSDSGDVAVTSAVTDAQGKLTAKISIGGDRSNRAIQITATSGSLVQSRSFNVTGSRVKATAVPSVLAPGANGEVQYQVVDVNGNPMAGQGIVINSSVSSVSAKTDTNGVFNYVYTAPSAATSLVITAVAAGVTQQDTVTVQSSSGSSKPDVAAGTILSPSVAANPSVVTVNEIGSSSNRSAIRALFSGLNNASIQNVRVRFDLNNDPNSVGGSFSSGSSIVYSDANGEASTFYIPGAKASPTNGVTVRACYGYTDAELAGGACLNNTTTTLTVASGAISVTIGTNNKLIELNNGLQLAQDFVVTVNDSAGRAKSDVDVVPSVDLISFGKGKWVFGTDSWGLTASQYFKRADGTAIADGNNEGGCWNEDRNRNGIKEDAEDAAPKTVNNVLVPAPYSETAGGNGNGTLEPRKADVVITVNGGTSAKTDVTGSAVVRISYARNLAGWLKYKILVSASGISGTEGRAAWIDILGVPLNDINNEAVPAFVTSIYGQLPGCQNPN